MSDWKNRIVESGMENPEQLLANPFNFRYHPQEQQDALEGVIDEIGWIQDVIVNRTTGHLIDGHLRVTLSMRKGENVPVKYVELTEREEKIALAAIDPISALATQDQGILDDLLRQIGTTDNDPLDTFLESLATDYENPEEAQEEARESLAERFIAPPFSVLDTKQGYWTARKKIWMQLGINSELGRGNEGDNTKEGLTYAVSSQPPGVYEFKNKVEAKIGRTMSWGEFAEKYPEEITLSGTSVFDPVLTEVAYTWFCPEGGKILDPFAGGSVRGIVAGILGYDYTGVELRPEQVTANQKQGRDIIGEQPNAPKWIEGDSRDIETLASDKYDLVFSCPPYANLEVYSDDPNDLSTMEYEDFNKAYRDIIKSTCAMLNDDRFAVFVVGEVRNKQGSYYGFVQDTIRAFENAGLSYYNEAVVLTSIGSNAIRASRMFTAGRKLAKGHQNALVFAKGQPALSDIKGMGTAIADHFNESRQVFQAFDNMMVFCKGDPKAAADALGYPRGADLEALELSAAIDT